MGTLRNDLVKLAYDKPALRVQLVPLLKSAKLFPNRDALESYLLQHPNADQSKHSVKPARNAPAAPKKSLLKRLFAKFKGLGKGVVDSLKAAPEHVHRFFADPEYRKGVSLQMKRAPKKIAKRVLASVREEYAANKDGFVALRKCVTSKAPLSEEENRALLALAVNIAQTALAATSAGSVLVGLSSIGTNFTSHVSARAVKKVVESGLSRYESLETAMGLARSVVAASKKDTPSAGDEKFAIRLTGHILDAFESLDDEDMEKILKDA